MPGHVSRLKDWTWHSSDFETAFGKRLPGKFADKWPAGKRIAVVLTFDTQADVDAAIPGYQTCLWKNGQINYCDLTMRQYEITEAIPRLLRILAKHDVRATFPTCGLTAEWYPEAIRSIAESGHEIAVHGYHHVPMVELTGPEQVAEIDRATAAIQELTGEQPKGWRCPLYTITEITMDHLLDIGYEWNSDFHDQDFPYVLSKQGKSIVEIPAGHDDWTMYLQYAEGSPQMGGTPYGTADGVLNTLRAEFDLLYDESEEEARMFQFCMHPKISGRPFRAAVLERLIEYMKSHEGVWFATCADIASLA